MASLSFTANLQRHIQTPSLVVDAATVRSALEAAFAQNAALRGYVLDDQGAVRKHVTIFVNGRPIADREKQTDLIAPADEVYVMQALSGG